MVTITASRLGFHVAVCVKLCVHKRTRYDAKNNLWCGWIYWCNRLNLGTVANASAPYLESEHVTIVITLCRLVFGEVAGDSSVTVVTRFFAGTLGTQFVTEADFLSAIASRTGLGPTQPPIEWKRGLCPILKAAKTLIWRLTSISSAAKNASMCTSSFSYVLVV
jgi:hypothetical protein